MDEDDSTGASRRAGGGATFAGRTVVFVALTTSVALSEETSVFQWLLCAYSLYSALGYFRRWSGARGNVATCSTAGDERPMTETPK